MYVSNKRSVQASAEDEPHSVLVVLSVRAPQCNVWMLRITIALFSKYTFFSHKS